MAARVDRSWSTVITVVVAQRAVPVQSPLPEHHRGSQRVDTASLENRSRTLCLSIKDVLDLVDTMN